MRALLVGRILVLLYLLASFTHGQLNSAPAGRPDPSFGENGIVLTKLTFNRSIGQPTKQSDGKFLIPTSVSAEIISESGELSRIGRVMPSGEHDPGFGNGGIALHRFGNFSRIYSVSVLANGKILLAGQSSVSDFYDADHDLLVARLNADGTLDTSFGTAGFIIKDLRPQGSNLQSNDIASALLIEPDGKILVGGVSMRFAEPGLATSYSVLLKLNSDGTVDTGFGNAGLRELQITDRDDRIPFYRRGAIMVRQSSGKIVKSVLFTELSLTSQLVETRSKIVRFHGNGELDTSFGKSGYVDLSDGFDYGVWANDLLLLPNDGLLAVPVYGLFKLTPDGQPDPEFGQNGQVLNGFQAFSASAVIDAAGRIYLSNSETFTVPGQFSSQRAVISRYLPNGARDLRFGRRGFFAIDFRESITAGGWLSIIDDEQLLIISAKDLPSSSKIFVAKRLLTK